MRRAGAVGSAPACWRAVRSGVEWHTAAPAESVWHESPWHQVFVRLECVVRVHAFVDPLLIHPVYRGNSGPAEMVSDAMRAAEANGYERHKEVFAW